MQGEKEGSSGDLAEFKAGQPVPRSPALRHRRYVVSRKKERGEREGDKSGTSLFERARDWSIAFDGELDRKLANVPSRRDNSTV